MKTALAYVGAVTLFFALICALGWVGSLIDRLAERPPRRVPRRRHPWRRDRAKSKPRAQ